MASPHFHIGTKYHLSSPHIQKLIQIIENNLYEDQVVPLHQEKKIYKEFSRPIKAVVFDVYGTLIHSAAGDIHTDSSITQDNFEVKELNISIPFDTIRTLLKSYVMEAHEKARQEKGIQYPEIDVIDMWKEVSKNSSFPSPIVNDENAALCAVYYEIYNNPSCAMPDAMEILEYLHEKNITLGIISNAQFYTPLFLEAIFHKYAMWHTLTFPIQVWSYKLLEAKPSEKLFCVALEKFSQFNIAPDEVVYIGNDKRNDVFPALSLDIGTVLYAGDKVSYRPRLEDSQVNTISPHRIISSLRDIYEFI